MICDGLRMAPSHVNRKVPPEKAPSWAPAALGDDVAARRKRRRSDGEVTRARVLTAAVESILAKGYYQTSSNEIARRAGGTWGTLQHQFGTREALLLELLNERWGWLQERVATAAYYLAEKRGFAPGRETEDWLLAEAQVDAADAAS